MEIPGTHQEQLEIWMVDPMTKWFFEQIDKDRKEMEEMMGRGHTVNFESVDSTAMRTAHNAGYVTALDFCTSYEFEGGAEDES